MNETLQDVINETEKDEYARRVMELGKTHQQMIDEIKANEQERHWAETMRGYQPLPMPPEVQQILKEKLDAAKAKERQEGGADDVSYKDLLDYDPNTGVFTWKIKTSSKAMPGTVAGWLDKDGYRCVTILGKKLKAHRLAWWWVHGEWPPKHILIDHKNRNPADNRIDNLRLATPAQSAMNRTKQSNNKSGYKGVFKVKQYWHARITVNKVDIPLGYHKSLQDAVAAYEKAAEVLHGEFYYGKD